MKISGKLIVNPIPTGGEPFCHPPLQNLKFRSLNGEKDPGVFLTYPMYTLGPLLRGPFIKCNSFVHIKEPSGKRVKD